MAEQVESLKRLTRQAKPKPLPKPEPKPVDPLVKAAALASQKQQKELIEKQKMEIYIAKERQEVLVFYMQADIQSVYSEFAPELNSMFEELIGQSESYDRDLERMDLETYLSGFGEQKSGLLPTVLGGYDLELIFDTIINERREFNQD